MTASPENIPQGALPGSFTLTEEERTSLQAILDGNSAPEALRARILLASDGSQSVSAVAKAVGVTRSRVYYWRRRFRKEGVKALHLQAAKLPPLPAITERTKSAVKSRKKNKRRKIAKRLAALAAIDASVPAAPDEEIPQPADQTPETTPAPGAPLVAPRQALGLLPGDSLAQAGKKVFSYFFAKMLEHETGTRLGEDIEALHDMRVATRRMRAAFDIFGAAYKPVNKKLHIKGLRSTGRALGAVRDWDVFLEKADRDIHLLSENDQANLAPLLERWQAERSQARESMVAYLDSETYRHFVLRFNNFVQTPGRHELKIKEGNFDGEPVPVVRSISHLAPVLIYTRLGAVRAFTEIIPHAKIIQLHALRIEFKRLHYTLDYLKEILGPEAKGVLSAVKRMQDHLGDLNDADVACQRLSALLENWEHSQLSTPLAERQTPASLLAYLSLKHNQRHDLLVRFPAAWEAFNTLELRQQLAAAVAAL